MSDKKKDEKEVNNKLAIGLLAGAIGAVGMYAFLKHKQKKQTKLTDE